jgi:hypothetical protein
MTVVNEGRALRSNPKSRLAAITLLFASCIVLPVCMREAEQAGLPGRSVGASDYQALGDPRVDVTAFAAALGELGVTFTRVWLVDAWAIGTGETGTYAGVLPVTRQPDGRWDLFAWNPAYFTRLRLFADEMNRHGIMPVSRRRRPRRPLRGELDGAR